MRTRITLVLCIIVLVTLAACASQPQPQATAQPAPQSNAPAGAAPNPQAAAAPAQIKLLKTQPEKGFSGEKFTLAGEGLPANKEITFYWKTFDGSYVMKAMPETVEFYERKFEEKRVPLGKATTDAQGKLNATFTVPEDFGEVHDIYGVLDGQDVAKAGYRLMRQVTISPKEGPVGTPITIKVTGLGAGLYDSTIGVRYDNKHTGFISAVTTRGSVTAVIRAAGPVGKRVIDIGNANKTVTYLNIQQSPVAHIPQFSFSFNVTKDNGAPPDTVDFPEANAVAMTSDAAVPRTASSSKIAAPGVSATLQPVTGVILTKTTFQAKGLTPNAPAQLFWVSARGNRLSPSGWNLIETPLTEATAAADGSLSANLQIPDDLGGWHTVKVVQGNKVTTEVPFFVERSLVSVTPKRVKVGETFTINVKGIGWTELDNTVAVTYDNAYIGYACGFNSNGDITLNLIATGTPGTHLIEFWPTIYQGQGKPPWLYQMPQLSALQDAPGLALGYRLPIFRLAIEVVE